MATVTESLMPRTSVRIAMLGSGFVAGFYMQGLANVGGQEVVANYSRKKHRARKFAQEWSIPEPTIELNKLIERDDIDLYVIAVPNEEHLPVSLALSRAKRNQVCTKPLARTPREAHAMLRAARTFRRSAWLCRNRGLFSLRRESSADRRRGWSREGSLGAF